jgi:hypothetical protein
VEPTGLHLCRHAGIRSLVTSRPTTSSVVFLAALASAPIGIAIRHRLSEWRD